MFSSPRQPPPPRAEGSQWVISAACVSLRALHCNSRSCSQAATKCCGSPLSCSSTSMSLDLFRISDFGFRVSDFRLRRAAFSVVKNCPGLEQSILDVPPGCGFDSLCILHCRFLFSAFYFLLCRSRFLLSPFQLFPSDLVHSFPEAPPRPIREG
jgi:hypothetical protein